MKETSTPMPESPSQGDKDLPARLAAETPVCLCLLDRNGRIRYVNRTYRGLTRNEVTGTPLLSWFPPKYHALVQTLLESVFSFARPENLSFRLANPQGEMRRYAGTFTPVLRNGKVESVLLSATDLTDFPEMGDPSA